MPLGFFSSSIYAGSPLTPTKAHDSLNLRSSISSEPNYLLSIALVYGLKCREASSATPIATKVYYGRSIRVLMNLAESREKSPCLP